MGLLSRIVVDTSALKDSRDFRLLTLGTFVSSLGSQIALVALPYQVYIITGSSFQVGLIGLVELVPFVAAALLAGTLADRYDRRKLLMLAQLLLLCTSTTLAVLAATGPPPVAAAVRDRRGRGGLLGARPADPLGHGAEHGRARPAGVGDLAHLRPLPGQHGRRAGARGDHHRARPALTLAYTLDAATFVAMFFASALLRPQPPTEVTEHEPVLQSIRAGLRFAWSKGELMGSFVIDILAMTFGMPRALFPALALTVYHAGPTGVGLLYAALSAGAVVAAFTTGWLAHVLRLGRIVVLTVLIWGVGITIMGLTDQLWVAMVCLVVAGRGRQHQRGVPLDDPSDRDARLDARADVLDLHDGRRGRAAARRRGVGHRRAALSACGSRWSRAACCACSGSCRSSPPSPRSGATDSRERPRPVGDRSGLSRRAARESKPLSDVPP